MPNLKRSMILMIACICFFMTLSCICASEVNDVNLTDDSDLNVLKTSPTDDENLNAVESGANDFDELQISIENDANNMIDTPSDKLGISIDDKLGIANPFVGFWGLNNELQQLKPGDVYNVRMDYSMRNYNPADLKDGMIIISTDNITINGNGHVLNFGGIEKGLSAFKILGNNVKIFNLTICNSYPIYNEVFSEEPYYQYVASPICWIGDNGVLSECVFYDNTATNGGTINWSGNNGVIEGCAFINSTARGAGGAIYIGGENNIIRESLFFNSKSLLTGEAIYIDRDRKNITVENILFDNDSPLMDGAWNNLDANMLYWTYYSYVGCSYVEMVTAIYRSLTIGGVFYQDDDVSYYSEYHNDTGDYIFTVVKEFDRNDVTYTKYYHFNNKMENFNFYDLYANLFAGNYVNKFTYTKNIIIDGVSQYNSLVENLDIFNSFEMLVALDYLDAINRAANPVPLFEFYGLLDFMEIDLELSNVVSEPIFALNIQFAGNYNIHCNAALDLTLSGFNVVNIYGHGSTIMGSYDYDEEEKWAILNEYNMLSVTSLNIEGFNRAVENMGGYCIFNHVNFDRNAMDYWFERDWGAAILNTGLIECYDCGFTNNYAKYGAAIFNQGLLVLQECYFGGNYAYGDGDNICVGNGGKVVIDGAEITSNNNVVYIAESMSVETATIITVVCIAGSFIAGAVVGFLTANPFLGLAAGAAVGAAIGSIGASIIISNTYDFNYDRVKTALLLIGGSALSGALGGFLGGIMGYAYQLYSSHLASFLPQAQNMLHPEYFMPEFSQYVNLQLFLQWGIPSFVMPPVVGGLIYYNTNIDG